MNYIENNPYRLLGVLSNSSMKEIVSNYGKIKAFTKIGKAVSYDNDFTIILGNINRDLQSIENANNALTLPKDRIVAGLFWFMQNTKIDEVALNRLRTGDIQGAIVVLRKKNTVSACVNLAVIHLIKKKWTTALYYYTYLLRLEERRQELQSIISDNSNILSEKEFVEQFVDKLLSTFPKVGWIEVLHQQEVEIEEEKFNINNFFVNSNIYECLIKKSKEKLKKIIEKSLIKANSVSKTDAQANLDAAEQLKKDAQLVLCSLSYVLGKEHKDFISLCNQVANVILDRCIDYYNHDLENPQKPKKIIQLLHFALRTAESKIAKDRCRKNYDQIKIECDLLLPEEIEGDISYIDKQIKEFKRYCEVSNYTGYLNAAIGNCYKRLESIKRKIGKDNIHYLNVSSKIVDFAVDVLHNEIESKHIDYQKTYNSKVALSCFHDTLEWAKSIFGTLKSFNMNEKCKDKFHQKLTIFKDLYEKYGGEAFNKLYNNINCKLTTSSPITVKVGEPFRVLFTINYRGEEKFSAPEIQGLTILDGPIKVLSFRHKKINGNKVSEKATTYYYDLKAERHETVRISPATIRFDGEEFKSETLFIHVWDEKPSPPKQEEQKKQLDEHETQEQFKQLNPDKSKDIKYGRIFICIMILIILAIIMIPQLKRCELQKSNNEEIIVYEDLFDKDIYLDSSNNNTQINKTKTKNRNNTKSDDNKNVILFSHEKEKTLTYQEKHYKTGDMPYRNFYGVGKYDHKTNNSLLIKNDSSDIVIFLENLYGEKTRHVYISKNDSFTMNNIPGGKYIIKWVQGSSWNPNKDNGDSAPTGGFMKNELFLKSKKEDPFDYPHSRTGYYYEGQVTLYRIPNGNFSTEVVLSISEFF